KYDRVEGIAFAHIEVTADDIITCAIVAPDLDALDIGTNALIHRINDGDRPVREIAIATRRYFRKGVAAASKAFREANDRCFHVLRAIDPARARLEFRLQRSNIDTRHR